MFKANYSSYQKLIILCDFSHFCSNYLFLKGFQHCKKFANFSSIILNKSGMNYQITFNYINRLGKWNNLLFYYESVHKDIFECRLIFIKSIFLEGIQCITTGKKATKSSTYTFCTKAGKGRLNIFLSSPNTRLWSASSA